MNLSKFAQPQIFFWEENDYTISKFALVSHLEHHNGSLDQYVARPYRLPLFFFSPFYYKNNTMINLTGKTDIE